MRIASNEKYLNLRIDETFETSYIISKKIIIIGLLTIAALITAALLTSFPAVLVFGSFVKGVAGA
jgi:hypothetical protein